MGLEVNGLLENHKEGNYKDYSVEDLLYNYETLGCGMSFKIHFLFSYQDFFPRNLGDVIDEQEERFYQDVSVMEKPYPEWVESVYDGRLLLVFCNDENQKVDRQVCIFLNFVIRSRHIQYIYNFFPLF